MTTMAVAALLTKARRLLRAGLQLPLHLVFALSEEGVDVEALEREFA